MCGIAGVLKGSVSAAPLIAVLAHRGPNGIRVEEGEGWSIGHARLSIIDLEGGWQPLHAAGSTIIGNGEIYNYIELTEQFGLKAKLATGSDFEPILHLYALEGEKAFSRLRGMYAFCLIGADGRTFLVRDPFGIKPLSYRHSQGALTFASEPRALLIGERPSLLADSAEDLLALNYITGPSAYAGIDALRPGEVLEIVGGDAQLNPSVHPGESRDPVISRGLGDSASGWTGLGPGFRRDELKKPPDEGTLLAQLDSVLEDSVRVHQRSDVPYGLFLSGGIDSAAIATLMSRLNARPVTAFTCGFAAPGARDERAGAERVARALNLDWRETTFTEEDFWRIAPQVAWALDEPTADYATLPTFKLADVAKGVLTVVLSGEGGDEMFGGYGRYRRALRPTWLGGRPAEPRIDASLLKDGGAGALGRWRALSQRATKPGMTRLQKAQAADIATWLPNDLLLKLDRMLMAHGLEGRTPFLDREVADFAFNLPDRMKVRGRYGKWLLRKWLERHCPAADPWGRKMGFTVPVAAWIGPRAADLGPRIAKLEAVRAVCREGAVEAAFADPARAKSWWPLLFFALWGKIHLEGAEPDAALAELVGAV